MNATEFVLRVYEYNNIGSGSGQIKSTGSYTVRKLEFVDLLSLSFDFD